MFQNHVAPEHFVFHLCAQRGMLLVSQPTVSSVALEKASFSSSPWQRFWLDLEFEVQNLRSTEAITAQQWEPPVRAASASARVCSESGVFHTVKLFISCLPIHVSQVRAAKRAPRTIPYKYRCMSWRGRPWQAVCAFQKAYTVTFQKTGNCRFLEFYFMYKCFRAQWHRGISCLLVGLHSWYTRGEMSRKFRTRHYCIAAVNVLNRLPSFILPRTYFPLF